MRNRFRSVVLVLLALAASVVLGVVALFGSAATLAATKALIMGGTGRPFPADFENYIPNVTNYYIYPNTACQPPACAGANLVSVFTPETAAPIYGGFDALTWRDSVLQGVEDLDDDVQAGLAQLGTGEKLIIFGYSQSGAINAIEKRALAEQLTDTEEQQVEWVSIGNVSRPNGGLNVRLPITIPLLDFPFGPPAPTDTKMTSTDIAFKWDIIADAPLVLFDPVALLNGLLGFQYVHGTMPDPAGPNGLDSTPGGYTIEQWQDIMNRPEDYAAAYPDIVNVQQFGDTKYITVTPRVMPLVQPLHDLGLQFVADLIEPALRTYIETTAYDRSIPYGQPTPLRLIPVFNPITLAVGLLEAIPEGITQAINGGPPPLVPPPAPIAPDASTALSETEADLGGTPDTGYQRSRQADAAPTPTVVEHTTEADLEDATPTGSDAKPAAEEETPSAAGDTSVTKPDDTGAPKSSANKNIKDTTKDTEPGEPSKLGNVDNDDDAETRPAENNAAENEGNDNDNDEAAA